MAGCKVCDVLDRYDIEYYDEELVDQWTAPKPERKGYRQLAKWLNVNLLRREMDKSGLSTLAGEVESKYERLQDDSPTAAELADYLASEGVRIDELQNDFVSYGVIRTHLQECLGATRQTESGHWESQSIDIALGQSETKLAEAVNSLQNKGKLAGSDELSVHVTAEIECEVCQARVDLSRAIRRGYLCSCGKDSTK
jgi:hypothetical protein